MKKTILSIALAVSSVFAFAQQTSVPDVNFEQALINLGYDTGIPNGKVPTANINTVTSLDVNSLNISDFTGIEDFTALTHLDCFYNYSETLNVSQNTALIYLSCGLMKLTQLDVSKNTALTQLACNDNQLTSLDVSQNTALTELYCHANQLTNLDASNNTALTSLNCSRNQLTRLNLSANTALTQLFCKVNQLTSLDLSTNPSLTYLSCEANKLTSLDLRNGNNKNFQLNTYGGFNATGNPKLTCINVDNRDWSNANWKVNNLEEATIDEQQYFSGDCQSGRRYSSSSSSSERVNTMDKRTILNYLEQSKFETNIGGNVVYITYGDISLYNAYGLTVGNNLGSKRYFINATVKTGYSYATVSGMDRNGEDLILEVYPNGSVKSGGLSFNKVKK